MADDDRGNRYVTGAMSTTTADEKAETRWRNLLRAAEAKRLVVLVLVLGFFGLLNPGFLSGDSFMAVLQAASFIGMVAVGQTLLITAGEFDLSVGSVAALTNVSVALLLTVGGVQPIPALFIGLGVGALAGIFNAVIVLRVGLASFIVTIGTMFVARGLAVYGCLSLMPGPCFGYPVGPAAREIGAISVLGLSLNVVVSLLLVIAGAFVLNRLTFGRLIRATGGNPEAARIAGVKTVRIKFLLFVLSGMCASLAGVMTVFYFGSGTHEIGSGWELTAIAAVVVGGTSLFGGSGTVVGTLLGLLILQSITYGMVAARIDPWWQMIVTGLIMLLALTVDGVGRRRRSIA